MYKIFKFISRWCEDILISLGLALIIITTYRINDIAASYILGVIFILGGLILSKRPPK